METFNVKRFACTHAAAFFSSKLASITKVSIFGDDFKKLVSSEKRLVKTDVANGKSFMYMRKSRGLRRLPWGTPHKIVFSSEKISFMHTYKFTSSL